MKPATSPIVPPIDHADEEDAEADDEGHATAPDEAGEDVVAVLVGAEEVALRADVARSWARGSRVRRARRSEGPAPGSPRPSRARATAGRSIRRSRACRRACRAACRLPGPSACEGDRRRRSQCWPRPLRHRSSRTCPSNAGVDHGVDEIGEEVDQHERGGDEQHDALGHEVLAARDRLGGELPETRDAEEVLDDDRSADEGAEVQAEDGDQRERRRAQGVSQRGCARWAGPSSGPSSRSPPARSR